MIKIGVTGNIGSGKTTFAQFFDIKKTFIFNADKEAKKHLKHHSVLQRKITNIFGNQILTSNELDFKKLAEVAFKNQKNQKILNGIIWPEVSMLIQKDINEAEKKRYDFFIVDAALLFEANYNHFFDYIILITADKNLRLTRALNRKNIDLSQIKKRMALQLSDKEKIECSDYTIENNSDLNFLKKQFETILPELT